MKKHISVLMLDLKSNMGLTFLIMAALLVSEGAMFALKGINEPSLGQAADQIEMVIRILWLIGLTAWLVYYYYQKRHSTGVQQKNILERLDVSERAVYLWSSVGEMIRMTMLFSFQSVLMYIMYLIYMKYGNDQADQIINYLDLNSDSILSSFFIYGKPLQIIGIVLNIVFIGICYGIIVVQDRKENKGFLLMIGFWLMTLNSAMTWWLIAGILVAVLAMLINYVRKCHTGKGPGRENIGEMIK